MSYKPLTLKAIKELAAPQTWPAAILPVLLAGVLSHTLYDSFSFFFFTLLMIISILLQSAVNTFNDYFDFKKGTDLAENSYDKNDASIIYNHIDPQAAFKVGLSLLGLALLGGLYLVYELGWPLLILGLIGALAVLLYSGGPYPISYLPIGELVSGLMMGGLLTIASLYVLSGQLSLFDLYYCIPLIISIGLILLTNNTCDIERDTLSGRHTLPILLGKKVSGRLLFWGFLVVIAVAAHLSFYHFRTGFWLIIPLLVHSSLCLKRLWKMQFTAINRRNAMETTLRLTRVVNSYYILIVLWEGVFAG